MSSAYQRQQIAKLCAKDETIKDANELLNIALAKTGPGSGHDLGKNAIALPAICAFLASERLGNNDVVKKVAQDVSCLKPLHFGAALSNVRGALSGHLSRRRGRDTSYRTTRLRTSVVAPSTPTRRKSHLPPKSTADIDVEMEEVQAEDASDATSEPPEDEEERPPPCRHYVPVFADRLFYNYRDPRVLREWEACEKIMKTLVLEH